ncbi:MAG TPA: flippase-like domain-containing protein [Trueperaceae bacterium]|nr:flippase-like domain-containing protein [Trueperaceae bacterium]
MKRMLALLLLSLGLGLGGLYLATRESILSPTTYQPANATPLLVSIAVASLLALWLMPIIKLMVLARAQGHKVGPGSAFIAHVGQVFGTAMTPSGTGGGPALVLALERAGVPVGTGLGIAVQLFVLDLAALGVLIPIGLAYLLLFSPLTLPAATAYLAGASAVIALVGSIILVRFPGSFYRLIMWAAKLKFLQRFNDKVTRVAREYYVSATAFRDMRLTTWFALHAVNLTAWLTNFLLLWALFAIYGAGARLLDVLALLSMITLIGFFVPTPGAAGFTELLVGLVAGPRSEAQSVAAPVALWRTGTFYIAYLLGPLCAWLLLSRSPPAWLRRKKVAAPVEPRPTEE